METVSAIATATAPTSLFDQIQTGQKAKSPEDGLSPNATRYGFIPIQPITGLNSTAFKRWDLPANRFLPFRPFEFPLTNAAGVNTGHTRPASEQLIDFYDLTATKHGIDFPELAALEDEESAVKVFNALTNKNTCSKYPLQLKNECATCWLDYLQTEAVSAINAEFTGNISLHNAAVKSHERLYNAIHNAIHGTDAAPGAMAMLNDALKMVDDPKSGKDGLVAIDYIYIYHTHQDLPKFKTSTDDNAELAKAITLLAQNQAQPAPAIGVSADDVKKMIADANSAKDDELAKKDAEIAELRAMLEGRNDNWTVKTLKCTGTNSNNEPCGANAVAGTDRCRHHPQEKDETSN